jgi:uncharacterized protein (DUF4415 family)
MSGKHTVRVSVDELRNIEDRTDWERVRSLTDREIDAAAATDADTFVPGPVWWNEAVLVPAGVRRTRTSLSIDEDVLAWYRQHGRGYQHLINLVLRRHMQDGQRRKRAVAAR